ncbi:hypothetical protein D9M68_390190 [compost metagenome]
MALTRKCAEAEMIRMRSPAARCCARQRMASEWISGSMTSSTKGPTTNSTSSAVRPTSGDRLKAM